MPEAEQHAQIQYKSQQPSTDPVECYGCSVEMPDHYEAKNLSAKFSDGSASGDKGQGSKEPADKNECSDGQCESTTADDKIGGQSLETDGNVAANKGILKDEGSRGILRNGGRTADDVIGGKQCNPAANKSGSRGILKKTGSRGILKKSGSGGVPRAGSGQCSSTAVKKYGSGGNLAAKNGDQSIVKVCSRCNDTYMYIGGGKKKNQLAALNTAASEDEKAEAINIQKESGTTSKEEGRAEKSSDQSSSSGGGSSSSSSNSALSSGNENAEDRLSPVALQELCSQCALELLDLGGSCPIARTQNSESLVAQQDPTAHKGLSDESFPPMPSDAGFMTEEECIYYSDEADDDSLNDRPLLKRVDKNISFNNKVQVVRFEHGDDDDCSTQVEIVSCLFLWACFEFLHVSPLVQSDEDIQDEDDSDVEKVSVQGLCPPPHIKI